MHRKLIFLALCGSSVFAQAPLNKVASTDGSGNPVYATVGDSLLTANTGAGLSAVRVCHATYNFGVDGGGSPGLITPAANGTLPANSIIYGALLNWTTAGVGVANTTSIGTTGTGGGAAKILTATAVGSLTGLVPVSLVTFALPYKITTSGTVTLTTAVAALTAGVCEIYVFYVVSPT